MTIFDMLLLQPAPKKSNPFLFLGSKQKGQSFESLLSIFLNDTKSLATKSTPFQEIRLNATFHTASTQNARRSEPAKNAAAQNVQLHTGVTKQHLQLLQSQKITERKNVTKPMQNPHFTTSGSTEKENSNTLLPKDWPQSQRLANYDAPVKKSAKHSFSIPIRNPHSKRKSHMEGFQHQNAEMLKSQIKTDANKPEMERYRLQKTAQNEHAINANVTDFLQKLSAITTDVKKAKESKEERVQGAFKGSATYHAQIKEHKHQTVSETFKKTDKIAYKDDFKSQTSVNEVENETPLKTVEQSGLPRSSRTSHRNMHALHNENSSEIKRTDSLSELSQKKGGENSGIQHYEPTSAVQFQESFATGFLANRAAKTQLSAKKSRKESGVKLEAEQKKPKISHFDKESLPNQAFEMPKPKIVVVQQGSSLQKPVQSAHNQEQGGSDTFFDVSHHQEKSDGLESEVIGMTHFEETNFERNTLQKEVRFLKIDQARVQVRLQNDQLHLDFLSQAPLMTDGVVEYVEHVMQEHGFENYSIRLKDRKRDLLITSAKKTTSQEARSMIDVKV